MAIYFSIKNEGFYHSDAGVQIPDDAIEITGEQFNQFLYHMNNENKMLVIENGELVLRERPINISWDAVKQKRNKLLSQSDYTQMPDWPGDKKAWSEYRQQLRDIPQNFTDTSEIVWPKSPNA